MDPNEALRELRDLVKDTLAGPLNQTAIDLSERFEALDAWLSKGGFLPKPWQPKHGNSVPNKEVVIGIRQGVAGVDVVPDGVTVVLRDYDVEYAEEGAFVQQDDDGEDYTETVHVG